MSNTEIIENEIERQIQSNDIPIRKSKIGKKMAFIQISDTMNFELKRNKKKVLMMLIFFGCIFLLFLLVQQLQEYAGSELPEDPLTYISSYLSMIGMVIIISSSLFAGSIIADDYQKGTRNLLFPKIGKTRLLIGRIIILFLLNSLCISFYYMLISIITFIKYAMIPISILESLGWALFYCFTLFSFVTFISSFMKSTSYSIIVSILLLLIVFTMLDSVLMFTGITEYIEPFFLITYYENIIIHCFDMPDPRYGSPIPSGPLSEFTTWLTPSAQGAFTGMLIYSAILLICAYIFFRIRQK